MPKSDLTEKYMERLTEMNSGYHYTIQCKLWDKSPIKDLHEAIKIYCSIEGSLKYRARGIAMAIRDMIRQREQKAAA